MSKYVTLTKNTNDDHYFKSKKWLIVLDSVLLFSVLKKVGDASQKKNRKILEFHNANTLIMSPFFTKKYSHLKHFLCLCVSVLVFVKLEGAEQNWKLEHQLHNLE